MHKHNRVPQGTSLGRQLQRWRIHHDQEPGTRSISDRNLHFAALCSLGIISYSPSHIIPSNSAASERITMCRHPDYCTVSPCRCRYAPIPSKTTKCNAWSSQRKKRRIGVLVLRSRNHARMPAMCLG